MKRSRIIVLLTLSALVVAVLAWPQPAHAISLLDILDDPISGILYVFVHVLKVMVEAVGTFVMWLTKLLLTVVSQPGLNYGGIAVYTVWKLFRDLCNSFFIVFFIIISFSTIFHSVLKGDAAAYYWRPALMNVIVAAVLVNFSLPIGQTIVWAGNQATAMTLGLIQGVNMERSLVAALGIAERKTHQSPVSNVSIVPDLNKPANQQSPADKVITGSFDAETQKQYEDCLANPDLQMQYALRSKKEGGPTDCYSMVIALNANENIKKLDEQAKTYDLPWYRDVGIHVLSAAQALFQGGGSPTFTGFHYSANVGYNYAAAYANKSELDPSRLVTELFIAFGNLVLLLLMTVSFLCIIAFMVLRLPLIWFLLAGSAVACFFYAVPKSPRFRKWWGDLVGYNIFGPLYLFVIYIGMTILAMQQTLFQGLANAQWYQGVFGAFLFTGIATAIFTGGAAAMWKVAFGFSKDLEARVTKWGGKVGVSEKTMFGLEGMSRWLPYRGRMEAAYEGAVAGAQKKFEKKFTEPRLQREADVKARWQSRFGDTKAGENLARQRISEQMKKNKDLGLSTSDLLDIVNDSKRYGSTEYHAAARELLDRGALKPDQMRRFVEAAGKISPSYQSAMQETVNRKLREQAKEKKFTGKDQAETMDKVRGALSAIADPSDRKKFLEDLKKNQVLEYALLARDAAAQQIIMDIEESTGPLTAEEIVSQNLSKVDADNFWNVRRAATAGGWSAATDAALDVRRDDLLGEKGNYYKLLDGAKDPVGRAAIRDRAQALKDAATAAEIEKGKKIREASAEAEAEAIVSAQERLEAVREGRDRVIAARGGPPTP